MPGQAQVSHRTGCEEGSPTASMDGVPVPLPLLWVVASRNHQSGAKIIDMAQETEDRMKAAIARDPLRILEKRETKREFELAQVIFKLTENQWEQRLQLLPEDQRPGVRRCLSILKEHSATCS